MTDGNSHAAGKKKQPSPADMAGSAAWEARKERGQAGRPGTGLGGGKHHTRDYDTATGRGGKPPKHKEDYSADRYAEDPTLTQPLMTRRDYGSVEDTKMASSLRTKLIRLAHAKPSLRPYLLPLVTSNTRLAHKPMLQSKGLNEISVKEGFGAMLYYISAEKNHSKFYEMLITFEEGMYVLTKKWGALTDSPLTGKTPEKIEKFQTAGQATAMLSKTYSEKVGKGYKDAFNRMMHVSPTTGETLPLGQYPVGLTRIVGFGWGTQSATKCIPSLNTLQAVIETALTDTVEDNFSGLLDDLTTADGIIRTLMRNPDAVDGATNESMGDLLAKKLRPELKRIQALRGELGGGRGRAPIPDAGRLLKNLKSIKVYLDKQLSYC